MNSKVIAILFTTVPIIAGILVVFEIISINRFVRSGKDVQTINNSIDALTQENALLEEHIASYSSIAAISDEAKGMGFVTPASTQYQTMVPDQIPVALKTPQ